MTASVLDVPVLPKKPSQKRAERREQYRKLGQAISSLGANYDGRDYLTGRMSDFKIGSKPSQDPELNSYITRGPKGHRGPALKTQQFERTVRSSGKER